MMKARVHFVRSVAVGQCHHHVDRTRRSGRGGGGAGVGVHQRTTGGCGSGVFNAICTGSLNAVSDQRAIGSYGGRSRKGGKRGGGTVDQSCGQSIAGRTQHLSGVQFNVGRRSTSDARTGSAGRTGCA